MNETERQHFALLSLKVSMLENLVKSILAAGFEREPDPVMAARQFADGYRSWLSSIPDKGDPKAKLLGEEVWNEFLDSLVSGVHRSSLPPKA